MGKAEGKVIKQLSFFNLPAFLHRAFLCVLSATDRAVGCGTSCEMLSTYPVILEKVPGAEQAVDGSGGTEAATVDREHILSLPSQAGL